MPPPGRAARPALIAVSGAWVLLLLVIAFRRELADEFAIADAWRGTLRRALLGASGVLALSGLVPAVRSLRSSPRVAFAAVILGVLWLAVVAHRLFEAYV